jgi:hypothetical protein
MLQPGDLVVLDLIPDTLYIVRARREPRRVIDDMGRDTCITIGELPHNVLALYIASHITTETIQSESRLVVEGAGFERLPAYREEATTYHFVLWNGRPVWISARDTGLKAA